MLCQHRAYKECLEFPTQKLVNFRGSAKNVAEEFTKCTATRFLEQQKGNKKRIGYKKGARPTRTRTPSFCKGVPYVLIGFN